MSRCSRAEVLGAFAKGPELFGIRGRKRGNRQQKSSPVNHITPHPLTRRILWVQTTGSQPNLSHQGIRQVLPSHSLAWTVSIPPQSWSSRLHHESSQMHFSTHSNVVLALSQCEKTRRREKNPITKQTKEEGGEWGERVEVANFSTFPLLWLERGQIIYHTF